MVGASLLLKKSGIKNKTKNILIKKGKLVYRNSDFHFDGKSINKILVFINALKSKHPTLKVPIIFELGKIEFSDKLTYVFLEIICYILIKEYGHMVTVHFNCAPNILIEGIESSPLMLLNDDDKNKKYKFLEKFSDEIYRNHYRKVLKKGNKQEELSKRMDEIAYFLKHSGVDDTSIDELSEVIIELVGNAWEHATTECLIDLDVTNSYFKKKDPEENKFLGINIVIINFSDVLLGDALKERILNDDGKSIERYRYVREAYKNHSLHFDEYYKEEDFFNMASFQHKISGRRDKSTTGGTGLTKLISSLEKRSDSHKCYLITGERAFWFYHQYLEYSEDGWIGFNKDNNFLNDIPAQNVIGSGKIYMPGTAYNLHFVIKGEERK